MATFGICQSPPTTPVLPSCLSLSLCPPARLPLMDMLYLGWPNHCHREQNLWAFRVGTLIDVLGWMAGGVTGSKVWVQGGGCLASIHPCTLQATSLATTYTSPCPPSPLPVHSYANKMPVKRWMRSEIWALHSSVEWADRQITGWKMHSFGVFQIVLGNQSDMNRSTSSIVSISLFFFHNFKSSKF